MHTKEKLHNSPIVKKTLNFLPLSVMNATDSAGSGHPKLKTANGFIPPWSKPAPTYIQKNHCLYLF